MRKEGPLEDTTRGTAVTASHGISKSPALSKVAYISPEQARGRQLDPRSDLFCLGAVLYEMATGTMPFRGDTPALVFDALLNRPPVTPTRLNPLLPVKVQAILLKLLEKNRDARYQSAKQLTADLTRVQKEMQREAFAASALASPFIPRCGLPRPGELANTFRRSRCLRPSRRVVRSCT